MWNHSSKYSKVDDGNLELNTNGDSMENIEKHLDLTNYLKFLQNLFNQSTSDSEGSEDEAVQQEQNLRIKLHSQSPSPTEIQNQNKFLSSAAAESTNSNSSNSESSSSGPSQSGKSAVDLPLSHPVSLSTNDTSDDSSSSTTSSSFSSDEDESSLLPSDLTPMSDLELNNLLKKTNYMGPDADAMSFDLDDSTSDSDKKRHNKKKKKKSKKKHDDNDAIQRQNKPNSGGKGNGPSRGGLSGFGGSGGPVMDSTGNSNSTGSSNQYNTGGASGSHICNSRARKQSLKVLRSEAAASLNSSGKNIIKDTQTSTPNRILPNAISNDISCTSTKIGFSGFLGRNTELNCVNRSGSKVSNSITTNYSSTGGLPVLESDDEDDYENDNDSLSDYMSMAATAAASTAQAVPPLPQPICNSNDSFFKFDDTVANGPSSSDISSDKSSSTTREYNCEPAQCHEKEHKRKRDVKDRKHESSKHKKYLLQKQAKFIELLNLKRRKVYIYMCKKEIAKTQRTRVNFHKEMLATKRRLAQACTRFVRQKAIQSQKTMKESVWRAKRLTREMQAYWKQADRVEREIRKRKEKEAEEQRKLDVELMEAKRQQRKLNFLITQTELYAHFMAKKLSKTNSTEDEETIILNQLNEETASERLAKIDDYDTNAMKNKVKANVQNAFSAQQTQFKCFDKDTSTRAEKHPSEDEHTQPKIFDGVLKHYQINGMNWLINLYDQGINGILADEMGLGKTVQSIAFLAHVAEKYSVWGPFLVIAPASTLHNWEQEVKRFVRDFKVVPYWGNPQERKILRQFWQKSNLHTPEASFHVVITSYNIVVQDLKYFNKVKWQYLILDEAQAIKSTASARWKILLGFNCRNRLLLTGTPIQNTMGELWALLHFIMPSLFDSHDEFNEWFSKDIESHAENKSLMDEKHLSRLHLILKPFMLRRIKKDVENELSDKIELLVSCPLTIRQRTFYSALKRKILVEDIIKVSSPSSATLTHVTRNLMNLVMQFRKVCNHPDLFERREVRSPFYMKKMLENFPKLIFRDGILSHSIPSKLHILENQFSIFNPINVHRSIFHRKCCKVAQRRFSNRLKNVEDLHIANVQFNNYGSDCEWSFLRFSGLSPGDIWKLYCDGFLGRFRHLVKLYEDLNKIHLRREWSDTSTSNLETNDFLLHPNFTLSYPSTKTSTILKNFVFTSSTPTFYSWKEHKILCIPESVEHRLLRSKKINSDIEDATLVPVIAHKQRPPEIRSLQATFMPKFVFNIYPKIISEGTGPYFYDRSAVWWIQNRELYSSTEELNCTLGNYYNTSSTNIFNTSLEGRINTIEPVHGWSRIVTPDREKLVTDSGKLRILDSLLKKLNANGHRVLIYSQMTKMIDLLEEFMWFRKWTYIRLDGSSKIAERRDMVADFQARSDIFVFLLSTRAGGLGINLTAADTVIFYDSDWNPTVDQQAMDRAHRLGQTKQVTVYRLICKGTVEERILQRAKEKNEIQRMVISGGQYRSDALKPKEVLSLLLDDEELERKYRQKQAERRLLGNDKTIENKSNSYQGLFYKTSTEVNSKYVSNNLESDGKAKMVDSGAETDPLKLLTIEASSGGSVEDSPPPSPDISDDMDTDGRDIELQDETGYEEDLADINPSTSSFFDDYPRTMEWNSSVSDYDEDLSFIPKKPKIGRGTGKRGRPPSRVRVQMRELDSGQLPVKRGPGRPRLKPIGPANQGIRGRRPGRPPLSKKAETISSLTPLTASQRVFGIYSSPDLNMS